MNTLSQAQKLSEIYKFLAQAMQYPDSSWFNADFISVFNELLNQLDWKDASIEISDRFSEDADLIEALQIEYTRLFINAVPHVVAPPYGSVYLTGDGALYGPTAEKTRPYYIEKGFDLKNPKEIPDHLVYELEFLALLAGQENEEDEHNFLSTFFRPWFSKFHDTVVKQAQHPYYKVLVQLIDFFTKEEQ